MTAALAAIPDVGSEVPWWLTLLIVTLGLIAFVVLVAVEWAKAAEDHANAQRMLRELDDARADRAKRAGGVR